MGRDQLSNPPPQVKKLLIANMKKVRPYWENVKVENGGEEMWRLWNLRRDAAEKEGYESAHVYDGRVDWPLRIGGDDDLYYQIQTMKNTFSRFWVRDIRPENMKSGQLNGWGPVVHETIQEHYKIPKSRAPIPRKSRAPIPENR